MTNTIDIVPATEQDLDYILTQNAENVHYLSPLDADAVRRIPEQGGSVNILWNREHRVGFLISYGANGSYESVNYQWFQQRLKAFRYIDRIVIDQAYRGRGFGDSCYQSLIDQSRRDKLCWLTAEIDIEPSNPGSLAFHQKHGFTEAGQQAVQNGKKRVSLQILPIG